MGKYVAIYFLKYRYTWTSLLKQSQINGKCNTQPCS